MELRDRGHPDRNTARQSQGQADHASVASALSSSMSWDDGQGGHIIWTLKVSCVITIIMVKWGDICDTNDSACSRKMNVTNKQTEQTNQQIHLLVKPALVIQGSSLPGRCESLS